MHEEQKEMFARAYRTGTDLWTHLPLAKARNEFLALLSPNALVLDVGAGRGLWARTLIEAGMRVLGLEYVGEQVEKNNSEIKNKGWQTRARFVEADALNIPFTDASFDAVTDIGLLQHMGPQEIPKLVQEIIRVVKPNGIVLLTTLSKETLTYLDWHPKASATGFFSKDGIQYYFASFEEIADLFKDSFDVVAYENELLEDGHVQYHHFIMKRKYYAHH